MELLYRSICRAYIYIYFFTSFQVTTRKNLLSHNIISLSILYPYALQINEHRPTYYFFLLQATILQFLSITRPLTQVSLYQVFIETKNVRYAFNRLQLYSKVLIKPQFLITYVVFNIFFYKKKQFIYIKMVDR